MSEFPTITVGVGHRLTSEYAVKDWLDLLAEEHGLGPEGTTSTNENGHVYETIAWTPQGQPTKQEALAAATFETPNLAWALWASAFAVYLKYHEGPDSPDYRGGKIYWRKRPVLQETEDSRYYVYARVFVDNE